MSTVLKIYPSGASQPITAGRFSNDPDAIRKMAAAAIRNNRRRGAKVRTIVPGESWEYEMPRKTNDYGVIKIKNEDPIQTALETLCTPHKVAKAA